MRVSREQAAHNRQKILTAATRLFRERGISATGVDAITADAGLTHGAVYSQFGSKEAIVTEAMREAQAGSRRLWQHLADRNGAKQAFATIVAQYLSRAHRDAAGRGCVVAALACEIARQPDRVRDAFTAELKEGLEYLAEMMKGDDSSHRRDEAIEAFATMVGALVLARAVNDERLSNRILEATAKRVIRLARSEDAPALPGRTTARTRSSRHAK
jgi:TetR/AcrR family transcriptional repressor of nem operon